MSLALAGRLFTTESPGKPSISVKEENSGQKENSEQKEQWFQSQEEQVTGRFRRELSTEGWPGPAHRVLEDQASDFTPREKEPHWDV